MGLVCAVSGLQQVSNSKRCPTQMFFVQLVIGLGERFNSYFFDRCRISHVNCEITKLKLGNTQHPHNCAVAPVLKG